MEGITPSATQIKLVYGQDMRRISFNGTTYNELVNAINQILGFPPNSSLHLRYQDEEQDWITVSSDQELQMAIYLFKDKILRISVTPPTQSNSLQATTPSHLSYQPIPQSFNQPQVNQSQFTAQPIQLQPSAPPVNQSVGMGYPIPNLSPDQQLIYYKYVKERKPWKDKKYKPQKEKEPKGKMAARFVRHITFDDDTPLSPNTPFVKTWRFRNESEYPWPANTCLLCVGRQEAGRMSGPDIIPVSTLAAPGQEADVSVQLTAPAEPGRYVGYYRLAGGPKGKKFGQRVRVQIVVV